LEKYKALAEELETELVDTKADMTHLKEENEKLLNEKSKMQEHLWGAKIEIMDIKNEIGSEQDGYFSPLKRLESMKTAFYKNEEIIQKQKQELEDKNILVFN